MPRYRATVQLRDIEGPDRASVKRRLQKRLDDAGLKGCQVTRVDAERGAIQPLRFPAVARPNPRRLPRDRAGLLLVAAIAWALWFFWQLVG